MNPPGNSPLNRRIFIRLGSSVLLAVALAAGIVGQKPELVQRARRFVTLGGLDREFSAFGERFRAQAALSDVAFAFEHLAVQTTECKGAGCVVRISSGRDYEHFDHQLAGGARTTDFFSDRQAFVRVAPAFPGDKKTRLKTNEPLDLTKLRQERRKDAFATWTLQDAKSEPFPILRKVGATGYSIVEELSPRSPGPEAGRWSFFAAQSGAADVELLKKSYFVVYDGYRKDHYFVQRPLDVIDCATDNRCVELAKRLSPSFDVAKLKGGIVALDLRPVDFQPITALVPKMNGLGAWWSQAPQDYIFPSMAATIFRPADATLATPADARRFSSFYRENELRGMTLGIPVRLDSYALVADGKTDHKLVRTSLPQGNLEPETLVGGLPRDHHIVFTRQLGTRRLGVSLYQAGDAAEKTGGRTVRAFAARVKDQVPDAADTPEGVGSLAFSATLGQADAGVKAYAAAHPDMSFASKAKPLDLIFGYWTAPRGTTQPLPTADTWVPVGKAKVAAGGEATTKLDMIGKPGKTIDAFNVLQSTLDGLASLGGYRLAAEKKPLGIDVHFGAMVCTATTAPVAANVGYPAPLEVSRAFLNDVAKLVGPAAAAAKLDPTAAQRLSATLVNDKLDVKFGAAGDHDVSKDPFLVVAAEMRKLELGKPIPDAVAMPIAKLRDQLKVATECAASQIDLVTATGPFSWEPFSLGLTCRALGRIEGHSLEQLWQIVFEAKTKLEPFNTARDRLVAMFTRAALIQQAQMAFDERYRRERPRESCLPASGDAVDKVLAALLVPIHADAARVTAQSSDTGAKIAAKDAEALWRGGEAASRRVVFHDSSRPRPMALSRGVKMRGPDLRGQKLELRFTLRSLESDSQTPPAH